MTKILTVPRPLGNCKANSISFLLWNTCETFAYLTGVKEVKSNL